MALTPGTRLGVFELTEQIGRGGMGEVYRARDTKLDRDVAIKILPEAFAHDTDRLARFQREAKTLASLNHPNMAALHGLEESGGITALVMGLVEGDDLSQRIARGAIPLDEALPIAKQIAEALEAAHEQGIIHRDLKPANIKVTPDGVVKVLDFGLAKLAPPLASQTSSLSRSPTITSPAMMTGVGVLLGTAAYMAPEQAKGQAADKRADVWAFGCVGEIRARECTRAGEHLEQHAEGATCRRETGGDTLSAGRMATHVSVVATAAPDVASGHLVYAAAGTLRAVPFDLVRLQTRGTPVPVTPDVVTTPNGGVDAVVAGDGTLAYVSGSVGAGAPRTLVWVDRQGREMPIPAPPRAYLYLRPSLDGTRVAVSAGDQEQDLWIWDLARTTLTRATFDAAFDSYPVWTPDGRRVVFSSDRAGARSR